MRNSKTTILVIEFQKTWTEKSFFHKLIKKEYNSRNVYQNTKQLLDIARKHNIPVIHAPFIVDKNNKEIYKKLPFPPKILSQFTANTWRAEYTDGIYDNSDIEVQGRCAFDVCIDSNLIEILNKNNIKKVYLSGFTTDQCVAKTMDTLISNGFECILLSDCTAARNNKIQKKIEQNYKKITSEQLINKINEFYIN